MVTNFKKSMIFLIAFLGLLTVIHAQDTNRFIQRLSWTHDENALRYEVEIQISEAGTYRRHSSLSTVDPAIVVSLPEGNYRYCVTPYNLFNRPERASEWVNFEIVYAHLELTTPSEEEYDDEEEESTSDFKLHTYLGAHWFTLLDIHGKSSQFEQLLSGTALRIGIVSSNLNVFNIGIELVPAWYSLDSLISGEETAQSLFLEVNFLLQKQFMENKAALTFRAGAGIILPIASSEYQNNQDPVDNTLFYANSGISFLWLPKEPFYIEAGVNYSFLFAANNISSRLRPWISAGIRL